VGDSWPKAQTVVEKSGGLSDGKVLPLLDELAAQYGVTARQLLGMAAEASAA